MAGHKHTPKPWSLMTGSVYKAMDRDGRVKMIPICHMDMGTHRSEREANARLIVASPVMLEALVDLVEILESKHIATGSAGRNARAAIDKATERKG